MSIMRIIVVFSTSLGFRDDSSQVFVIPPPGVADTVGDVLVALVAFFSDEPWWPPGLDAFDLGFESCQDSPAALSPRLPVEALSTHSDQPDMILRLSFLRANRRDIMAGSTSTRPQSRVPGLSAETVKTKVCTVCLSEKSKLDFSAQTWKSKTVSVCRTCNVCKQQGISDTAASRGGAARSLPVNPMTTAVFDAYCETAETQSSFGHFSSWLEAQLKKVGQMYRRGDLSSAEYFSQQCMLEERLDDAQLAAGVIVTDGVMLYSPGLESGSDAESDGSSDSESDSEGDYITDAFAHWSLYWHHVEALGIADKFSSGQIDDAELLSQRFGLEEKLEALQRVDYGIFEYAGEYYKKKVGSWHCDCDVEGMEMARRAWCVQQGVWT